MLAALESRRRVSIFLTGCWAVLDVAVVTLAGSVGQNMYQH